MTPDDLTAELDHIAACIDLASELPMTADPRRVVAIHSPRLLAALRAAIGFHVEAVIEDMPEPRFRYCKTCSGHPAWPCPEVAAILHRLREG